MLQMYLIDVAIPHQSQIGFEEPICDSFPPGEAFGAFLNCKIIYNLNFRKTVSLGFVGYRQSRYRFIRIDFILIQPYNKFNHPAIPIHILISERMNRSMSNREKRRTLIFAIAFTLIGLACVAFSEPSEKKYALILLGIAAIDWCRLAYNAYRFRK